MLSNGFFVTSSEASFCKIFVLFRATVNFAGGRVGLLKDAKASLSFGEILGLLKS